MTNQKNNVSRSVRVSLIGPVFVVGLSLAALPGMAAAAAASIASLGASGGVAEEINAGTLEQTHLSPVPAWALAAGRLGALAVEALAAVLLGLGWTTYRLSIRRALREGRLGPR